MSNKIAKNGDKYVVFQHTKLMAKSHFESLKSIVEKIKISNDTTETNNLIKKFSKEVSNDLALVKMQFPRILSIVFKQGITISNEDYDKYIQVSKDGNFYILPQYTYYLEYKIDQLQNKPKDIVIKDLEERLKLLTPIEEYNKKFKKIELCDFSDAASKNAFKNISIPSEMCAAYNIADGEWWVINKFKKNKGIFFATLENLKKQLKNIDTKDVIIFKLTEKELLPIEYGNSDLCTQFYSDYEKNKLSFSLSEILHDRSAKSINKLKI